MTDDRPARDRREWVANRRDDLASEDDGHRWRRGLFSASTPHHPDWRSRHWASRGLHRVGELVANAATGVISALLVLAWVTVGLIAHFPQWWSTGLYVLTGSVTFVMVFVIQHTQTRQITALQRKLDELVRATQDADPKLIAVEEAPDEELQALADLNMHDRDQSQPE